MLLIFIASQRGTTAVPVSCISYSLSSPPACLLLLHTLELYFCVSSISPPTPLFPRSLTLLSLSSSLSPSISLCQMLRPLCLCVVYIWWLTFPGVTAPFSPQCVSSSARSVYFVFCLVFPGEENGCPDHSFCCCCIYFVFQRQQPCCLKIFNDSLSTHWCFNMYFYFEMYLMFSFLLLQNKKKFS